MPNTAERLASHDKLAPYDELMALPDNVVGEIIADRLHTQPRLVGKHALAHSGLHGEIDVPFHKGRGGPGG